MSVISTASHVLKYSMLAGTVLLSAAIFVLWGTTKYNIVCAAWLH